jgi:signal transduction histidine kinase
VLTVGSFTVAALAFVAGLYARVPPFANYRGVFDRTPLPLGTHLSDGRLELAVFLTAAVVASLACFWDAGARARARLHRLDYFFVVLGIVVGGTLLAGLFVRGRYDSFWHVVCLTGLAVLASYGWCTTLVRLRAGTIRRTVFWPRVFETLPLRQFSGIFILAVVIGGVLLLANGVRAVLSDAVNYAYALDTSLVSWLWAWFSGVALPVLALAVVAVLCRDLIAITVAKERAVEARLREERFRAELITNVTHDIRTPLTSIVNYVDLIDKLDLDDPRLAEYTEVLGRKADRLKVLIGDLLEASRASAGNLPVRLEPIEVTEILGQIAGDFDDAFAARGLTWVGPAAGHDMVEADGEHLWRILENLVGNVVKYAKPGSCVHADLHRLPGTVRLSISNRTAEPIFASADELLSQFVRGDAARHSEGSGLGLFIADRLARLMGASLTLGVDGDRFTASVDLPTGHALPAADRADGWEPTRPMGTLEPTRPIETAEPTRPIQTAEPTVVLAGRPSNGGVPA